MGAIKNIKLAQPEYSDVVPSSKEKFTYRPFRVAEEKILLVAAESKDSVQMATAMKNIIGSCTGLDAENLTFYDIEYLFTKIRSKSVGESVNVTIKCNKCEGDNQIEIQLDTVYVQENEELKPEIVISDELVFVMHPPKIDMLHSFQEGRSEVDNVIEIFTNTIAQIQNNGEIIDVTETDKDDLRELLNQLNSDQFVTLNNYYESIPKAHIDYEFECTHCKHINKESLTGMQSFF